MGHEIKREAQPWYAMGSAQRQTFTDDKKHRPRKKELDLTLPRESYYKVLDIKGMHSKIDRDFDPSLLKGEDTLLPLDDSAKKEKKKDRRIRKRRSTKRRKKRKRIRRGTPKTIRRRAKRMPVTIALMIKKERSMVRDLTAEKDMKKRTRVKNLRTENLGLVQSPKRSMYNKKRSHRWI